MFIGGIGKAPFWCSGVQLSFLLMLVSYILFHIPGVVYHPRNIYNIDIDATYRKKD